MKRKFLSVLSIALCILALLSLSACSSKEKELVELYSENATRALKEGEITDVSLLTDSLGGKVAVISVRVEDESGLYVLNTYNLVLSEIKFNAEKITLSSFEKELYGDSIKDYDGETVEKGYFSKVKDIGEKTGRKYEVLMAWKLHQAQYDDSEYDIDKINELLAKEIKSEG